MSTSRFLLYVGLALAIAALIFSILARTETPEWLTSACGQSVMLVRVPNDQQINVLPGQIVLLVYNDEDGNLSVEDMGGNLQEALHYKAEFEATGLPVHGIAIIVAGTCNYTPLNRTY